MTTMRIRFILWAGLIALLPVASPPVYAQAASGTDTTRIPFDVQFQTFRKLGFRLNPGISEAALRQEQEAIEKDPYATLYQLLGQTIEEEPFTPFTDKCWEFDTEAIEGDGSYVRILKEMERLSGGELRFENPADQVSMEQKKAWVSFTLKGKAYKWDLKVEDDWVDVALFSYLAELTRSLGTKGKYTYFDIGGQSAVIGYETQESLRKITEATGLKIEWLQ